MNEIASNQRGYTEAGPWDRLGTILRVTLAVAFLAITVAFIVTAQNGLVSAGDIGAGALPASAPAAPAQK